MLPIVVGTATLVKDPEIRWSANGMAITTMPLAFNETWKDKSGNRKEKTTYIDGIVFGNFGESVANVFLKQGSRVTIKGKLGFQQWQQDGMARYKHSIIIEDFDILDKFREEGEHPSSG